GSHYLCACVWRRTCEDPCAGWPYDVSPCRAACTTPWSSQRLQRLTSVAYPLLSRNRHRTACSVFRRDRRYTFFLHVDKFFSLLSDRGGVRRARSLSWATGRRDGE